MQRQVLAQKHKINISLRPAVSSRKQRSRAPRGSRFWLCTPAGDLLVQAPPHAHGETEAHTGDTTGSGTHSKSLAELGTELGPPPPTGPPRRGPSAPITASQSPGLPGCSRPWFMTPRSPSEVSRRRGPGPPEMGSAPLGPGSGRSIARVPP